MAELVPHINDFHEIYADSDPAHRRRWTRLLTHFEKTYGERAEFVARSPGRVNVIGEHIDYSLLGVLPMSVTVDALLAVRVVPSVGDEAQVKIANVNPEKYPARSFTVPAEGDVEIDISTHEWTNYFRAGLRGAIQVLRKTKSKSFKAASMDVLVDGNVPAGGGMSSSAALVCASALAVMKTHGDDVSKQELLDLAVVSERAVGVFSGGMDQAASIFSKRGYLLYCRFFPSFHAEHVRVPRTSPEVTFLVAQSFVTSDKAVTAKKHYNLRVIEVALAAVMLAKIHDLHLQPDDSAGGFSLRGCQEQIMTKQGHLQWPLGEQVTAMVEIVERCLHQEDGYTRGQMADVLGMSVESMEEKYMSKFPVEANKFFLRQRASHTFQEAKRVLDFKNTLTSSNELDDGKLRHLGEIMNDCQESCRQLYECSCPEIDQICRIAREAGTYGSRLTGAGWGGCTVHLVPQNKVETVKEALKREYYYKHFPDITEDRLHEAIVTSKPSQGSSLISGAPMTVR